MVGLRDVPKMVAKGRHANNTRYFIKIVALREIPKYDRKGHYEVVHSFRAMTGINELDVNLD